MQTRTKVDKTLKNNDLYKDGIPIMVARYPEIAKIVIDERNKFLTYVLQSSAGMAINKSGIKQNILNSG